MYYKIINTECEVYKKLLELRIKEIQIGRDNIVAIEEKTGLDWGFYLGRSGQQTIRRTTEFEGFEFKQPEKVDLKIWKRHPEHNEIFVPNKRTKAGREMAEFLANGLKYSRYDIVFDILKLPHLRRFIFPMVELIRDGGVVVFLDDDHEPEDENLIEITREEFNRLLIGK